MRYKDMRKPNDRTVDALVIEQGDTIGDILHVLDHNARLKEVDPHDESAPVKYWVVFGPGRLELLSISEIFKRRNPKYSPPKGLRPKPVEYI